MNILDTIIAHKRAEVQAGMKSMPVESWKDRIHYGRTPISLVKSFNKAKASGVIAEHKRRSPSKGQIGTGTSLENIVTGYQAAGATAVSMLTDDHFFGGSALDLEEARSLLDIPILRKDFVIDPYQLHEAKAIGADVILLIAEVLSAAEVQELAAEAKVLGMEVLMEMHDGSGLEKLTPDVDIVGINNRDLKTFTVDLDKSIQLLHQLPDDKPTIAESGIDSAATMARLRKAGFSGFLIGETFMKTSDPGKSCQAFIEEERHIHER